MRVKKLLFAVFMALGILSVPVFAAENKLELSNATRTVYRSCLRIWINWIKNRLRRGDKWLRRDYR